MIFFLFGEKGETFVSVIYCKRHLNEWAVVILSLMSNENYVLYVADLFSIKGGKTPKKLQSSLPPSPNPLYIYVYNDRK